jgi:hypothetical protein
MGGHAVRYYGVDRNTFDYDFHLALDPAAWAQLAETLRGSPVLTRSGLGEGPSWRPAVFRRFVIGTLPDGREERLEFWRANHLLAAFDDLHARAERGEYGGRPVLFLSLADLIRSKETEREDDWRDVQLLEEIADERGMSALGDSADPSTFLSRLRSRKGFERALAAGLVARAGAIQPDTWIAYSLLRPAVPGVGEPDEHPGIAAMVRGTIAPALDAVESGSARHLVLVEAVRRLRKQAAMAADRADKQAQHP